MKIRTRLAVASLITIAVLSVAGCGGDDGPSRQEFIAQADAICQKANKGPLAEGKYGENFSKAAFLSRHNAAMRDVLERLRALDAPEADRAAVDDLLSAFEGSVAATDNRIDALRAHQSPRLLVRGGEIQGYSRLL